MKAFPPLWHCASDCNNTMMSKGSILLQSRGGWAAVVSITFSKIEPNLGRVSSQMTPLLLQFSEQKGSMKQGSSSRPFLCELLTNKSWFFGGKINQKEYFSNFCQEFLILQMALTQLSINFMTQIEFEVDTISKWI